MDLALEAGHTALLTHGGLRVHMEVGHGWRKKRKCVWGRRTAEVQRGWERAWGASGLCPGALELTRLRAQGVFPQAELAGAGQQLAWGTSALTLPPTCGKHLPLRDGIGWAGTL